MNLFQDLQARGLLEQCSDPAIEGLLARGSEAPVRAYCGFDPTAASLHVGSLMPLLGLMRLQRAGHQPIAVVGGATGLIGDPSGKSQERQLLSPEIIAVNVDGIRRQFERVWSLAGLSQPRVVNNADWFATIPFIEFLRDIGKHFSVNAMIAKESVRARLEERDQGISFTEFSYMLLQAYDFLWLHEHESCTFQIGGSDQWGNITAGIDLIRRKRQQPAYGYTLPLITTADGKKFGKTEQGTVWLDADRTSPYQLYQYFLNIDDRDVGRFLRYFTFLDIQSIDELEQVGRKAPEKREAQRSLAFEVTAMVHGADEANKAAAAAKALFTGGQARGKEEALNAALVAGAPSSTISKSRLDQTPPPLLADLLRDSQLCESLSDARRQMAQGGVYLNEERISDSKRAVTIDDLIQGQYLLLRKGKKNYHIVRVVE